MNKGNEEGEALLESVSSIILKNMLVSLFSHLDKIIHYQE